MFDFVMSLPPGVTTLVTCLVGACVALIVMWRSNRASLKRLELQLASERSFREKTERRERVTELYVGLNAWTKAMGARCVAYLAAMDGRISLDAAHDISSEVSTEVASHHDRLDMVIQMHFPEFAPAYSDLLRERDAINQILHEHASAWRQGRRDGKSFSGPFIAAQTRFERASEILKDRAKSEMGS